MDSWDFTASGLTFHEAFAPTEDCTVCHNPNGVAAAKDVVTEFHDGLETERVGIIYGGEDLSVSWGERFTWKIDSVVDDKTNLKINWSATYDKDGSGPLAAVAVNPCNTTVTADAPGFFPFAPNTANEGTLSMLRSYAQGDDYVLGQANAPGQAAAVNLSTTNTVCAANVATTTIPVDAAIPAGTRAIVALQGKPQLPVPAGMSTKHWTYPLLFVRVPTPTYEFIVGTGAKATTPRREIADTGDRLKCHVGSLYQHGNTRVDNVTMCIICHNSASSDQNNRTLMGVNASEAYDGKVGQTYELKTMLHAIHSAGAGSGDDHDLSDPRHLCLGTRRDGACELAHRGHLPQLSRRGGSCADHGLHRLRSGSGGDAVVPDAQPVPPDLSAGVQRLRGVPQRHLRPDPRPGQGRGHHARRRCDRLGHGHEHGLEEPARRHAAGCLGGRLHELPPDDRRAAVMRTRMAGCRRPSRTDVRPFSIRSELMFD